MAVFQNRLDAGKKLAERLLEYKNKENVIILGLPRGGVPVAGKVAKSLKQRLEIFLVRKLGVPSQKELAMGAIATGGVRILNEDVLEYLQIPQEKIDEVFRREKQELARLEREYGTNIKELDLAGKTVILIDDGLATGSSMRAAAQALKALRPAQIIIAVPTAPKETCHALSQEVDKIVCLQTPEPFTAIGDWYQDFSQVTDDEVREIMEEARG
jgi:putative phosphoribosyl transferase